MSEEILINVTPRETRVALLENGAVLEVYIERARRRGLVGNIYKGRVSRVLPGMQAAFIDIGLERTAFLHASDIAKAAYSEQEEENTNTQDIRELLQEGMELLVQVLKDPLGTKGARLTTYISIPSRYLVYLPGGHSLGISVRIEDQSERDRLKDMLGRLKPLAVDGGYIVRTAGEGAKLEALRADMLYLNKLWEAISVQAGQVSAGTMVHEDLPLHVRILRDLLDSAVTQVRVDSEEAFERMRGFASRFIPEMAARVEHYTGQRPIFDLYGVEEELQNALNRKVQLKSGGYLMIDQTEAMTTIDVNTGAFVGSRNLEETIVKTNLEAAQAIAAQLRLRNLGGIVIIDFIDMEDEEHKTLVLEALEKGLASDHAKTQISEVSQLGLVQMTRKRTRESLEHVLSTVCPLCQGRGSLKSAETVCYEIFREILRESRQLNFQEIRVLASQEVVDLLLDEESTSLAELEAQIHKPIRLQAEVMYGREQFDVVPM